MRSGNSKFRLGSQELRALATQHTPSRALTHAHSQLHASTHTNTQHSCTHACKLTSTHLLTYTHTHADTDTPSHHETHIRYGTLRSRVWCHCCCYSPVMALVVK